MPARNWHANLNDAQIQGRIEKTGPLGYMAAMAVNIFKVPIAFIVFIAQECIKKEPVDFPLGDGVMDHKSLNSSAVLYNNSFLLPSNKDNAIFLLADPLNAAGGGFGFYAGAPLIDKEGCHWGTVCLLDKNKRELTEADQILLEELAAIAIFELEEQWFKQK